MSGKKRDAKSATHSIDAKKAAVLGRGGKRKMPFLIALAATALAAGGGIYLLKGTEAGPAMAVEAAVRPGGEFSYPANDFADGRAKYFSYRSPDGLNIRYFIIRSSDGIIRAAFDSCDTCWSAGKGYRQEGDLMVCNNCGQDFASLKINEVRGGCNPAPLTRTVQGDQVIIKAEDLIREGSFYFDYDGRG